MQSFLYMCIRRCIHEHTRVCAWMFVLTFIYAEKCVSIHTSEITVWGIWIFCWKNMRVSPCCSFSFQYNAQHFWKFMQHVVAINLDGHARAYTYILAHTNLYTYVYARISRTYRSMYVYIRTNKCIHAFGVITMPSPLPLFFFWIPLSFWKKYQKTVIWILILL